MLIVGFMFILYCVYSNYSYRVRTMLFTINKYIELVDRKNHDQNVFDFNEPSEAQLISSSLGVNKEILLRYLYKGKNTLVILDVKTKKIKSIVTIKKAQNSFNIN